MITIIWFMSTLMVLGATTSYAEQRNKLSPQETAAGWRLLFDGHDLAQWRNYRSDAVSPNWTVEDGAITLQGGGGGDLVTRRSFRDFELKLEWKISRAGNSGIFILVDEDAQRIYTHAPEVQILDNERHSDNKFANHLAGSVYDLIASPVQSHRPAGQWNKTRIILQDLHFAVGLNDIQVADIQIGGKRWNQLVANSKFSDWAGFGENRQGHIGLQDHGDRVQFRNIKIRELNLTAK